MASNSKTPITVAVITGAFVVAAALVAAVVPSLLRSDGKKTSYQGRVINKESQAVVGGAMVSIDMAGVPPNTHTDNYGIFHFDLPGSPPTIRVRVDANGYEPFNEYVPLTEGSFGDIRLTPKAPAPTPTATPTPQTQPAVPGGRPPSSRKRAATTNKLSGQGDSDTLNRRLEGMKILNNGNKS